MDVGMNITEVSVEWALWGKRPGGSGYQVLSCSQGALNAENFTQILTRYSPGTPDVLPEVTISRAGKDDLTRVGLAVQEWSDERDRHGRPVAVTRYYCVPYAQLAARPVSYLSMYEAFGRLPLPTDPRPTAELPRLRYEELARQVSEHAMGTAALLLSRQPVCIVHGEGLSLEERLRYLDTVASLLPYGMRAKFSASTWVSPTAAHQIRLSFSEHPRSDSQNVYWGRPVQVPFDGGHPDRYLGVLRGHADDPAGLVRLLAEMGHPCEFQPVDFEDILSRLGEPGGGGYSVRPTARDSVMTLLGECADALGNGRGDQLEMLLNRLDNLRLTGPSEEERAQCRRTIAQRGMLREQQPVNEQTRGYLYRVLVLLAFNPGLSAASLPQIAEVAGGLHRPLLDALLGQPDLDTSLKIRVASERGDRELRKVLQDSTFESLVDSFAKLPADKGLLKQVWQELLDRADGDHPEFLRRILHRHGHLAGALERFFPSDEQLRYAWLSALLRKHYRPRPSREQLRELARGHAETGHVLLFAAAALYGPGAGEVLVDGYFGELLEKSDLGPRPREQVREALAPARPRKSETKVQPVERSRPEPVRQGRPGTPGQDGRGQHAPEPAGGGWWRLFQRQERQPSAPRQADGAQHYTALFGGRVIMIAAISLLMFAVVVLLFTTT